MGARGEAPRSREPLVRMIGITKRFPGVIANDKVDFELMPGEVHALLGENGAGKTTLMNILYGLYRPDEGQIFIDGREVEIRSPRDAMRLGIGMVHQHFKLVSTLTVAENIALSLEGTGLILPARRVRARILEVAQHYGLEVDPDARIWQLSVGERQRVEILKLLIRNAKVLILDEPTTVLAPGEREELFKVLRKLAYEGRGIVFITHKLEEVFRVADRVTVLRKGRVVASGLPVRSTTPSELAKLMIGRELKPRLVKKPARLGEPVLEVEDLSVLDDKGLLAVRGVSFNVRRGEILGIAGVAGNGQRELVEAIIGLRKPRSGRIRIDGHDVTGKAPADVLKLGVAYIPEDRARYGIVPDLSVAENLILKLYKVPPFKRGFFLDEEYILSWSRKVVSDFGIVTPNVRAPAGSLSGGNIQRLILARELSTRPKLIVASHPTFGLDVAATEQIRSLLIEQRERGAGVLLVSEDLSEIMELSDRIAVMHEGQIVGLLSPSEADVEKIGLMMSGKLKEVDG